MKIAFFELGRTPNATAIQHSTIGRANCKSMGLRRTFAEGEVLFKEGEAVDCHDRTIVGTIRSSTLLGDSRRQIEAFSYSRSSARARELQCAELQRRGDRAG